MRGAILLLRPPVLEMAASGEGTAGAAQAGVANSVGSIGTVVIS